MRRPRELNADTSYGQSLGHVVRANEKSQTWRGARNAFAESKTLYPKISTEDLLKRNPDLILVLALGNDRKPFEAAARKWLAFPGLRATQLGQVRVLKADALLRPSLRLLEGLSVLGFDTKDANFAETAKRAAKGFHELVHDQKQVNDEIEALLSKTFPAKPSEKMR